MWLIPGISESCSDYIATLRKPECLLEAFSVCIYISEVIYNCCLSLRPAGDNF